MKYYTGSFRIKGWVAVALITGLLGCQKSFDYYKHEAIKSFEYEFYPEALAYADSGLALQPQNALLYAYKGRAYTQLKDFRLAKAAYDSAIKRDKENASWYMFKGMLLAQQNNGNEALANYDQAERLRANYDTLYMVRGDFHMSNGDKEKALEDYQKAVAASPYNASAHARQAKALMLLGQINKAAESIQKAIEYKPGHAPFLLQAGDIYYVQKDYPKALENYGEAVKKDSSLTQGYLFHAEVLNLLDRPKEALDDCRIVLSRDSTYRWAWYHSGVAQRKLGQYEQACISWRKAAALGDEDAQSKILEYCP